MKIFLAAMILLNMNVIHAETLVLTSETINVDGYMTEKKVMDLELENLQAEIKKQKEETILNKKKSKSYQELTKSVEKLSETTVEYLEEKNAAKEEIANYNNKVKCLQSERPGPECDKYLRRR